jgi:hypothetical protein
VCSPQTVGEQGGSWCPFGRSADQAGDQQVDDARSLVFETQPLSADIEILGAPIVMLDVAADRKLANLVVRLCDVRPDGTSLRVSYGILNLAHRDGHAAPMPLVPGQRYRVRMQLNDAGAVFPAGHRIRVAISTTYWPMIWPPPENATVTLFDGALELPVCAPTGADAELPALLPAETAAPEPTTVLGNGALRIDRLGIELGSEGSFDCHIAGDDPLSAVLAMRQSQSIARGAWRVRIETTTRLSCTRDAFVLAATMRAYEGDDEVCAREWSTSVPRRLL